jgi:YidC/Oxa1 family membrane protein insertase
MDKKSVIGLLIIGAILFIFSYFNASTAPKQDPKNKTEKVDSTKNNQDTLTKPIQPAAPIVQAPEKAKLVPVLNDDSTQVTNDAGLLKFNDPATGLDTFMTAAPAVETTKRSIYKAEEVVRIENDKIAVDISSKGGRIISVFLKEYKTYDAYLNKKEEPLQLFDRNSTYGIDFAEGDKTFNSARYDFDFVNKTANSVTVEMINPTGKKIGFTYKLKPSKYDVDFGIYFRNFTDADTSSIALTTDFRLLSTEKYLPAEKQIATIFYKYKEDSYDYLSTGGDDELKLEETTEWVAFKQSYFSAILMNKAGFKADEKSELVLRNFGENDTTYIKNYKANLDLGITNIKNTVELQWYFGPNDYSELSTYNNGSEDIVDLGWGLFRWINVYGLRPIFGWLMNWGVGAGMAIFLLTLLVKLLLSPVNYKMYKSSAMMKVLRPEIEKIGKKFPKKEDAIKKQQETMALYRETGVSPLAGCIPMLIQMPILFAIFRLFPAELSLRQKSFWWAEDLSTYDSILQLGFNIPFYGDHISLFTLLMAGTTLWYTHQNSSNMQQPTMEGMPNMKYIMYIFPFLMIFFFNSFSAGLSYYYFISTLMTIAIMWAIKRFMLDEAKIIAKVEANRANPPKKKAKSKFQMKLEEAQRLQQERQKGKK